MIEIEWGNAEHNVIVWTFHAPWTFEELHAAKQKVDVLIDAVEGDVDGIFVTTHAQSIPPTAINNLLKIGSARHPRYRYTVMVRARSFLTVLLDVAGQLVPHFKTHLYHTKTLPEAYALLEKLRSESASVPMN